jgi:hypothetical protein
MLLAIQRGGFAAAVGVFHGISFRRVTYNAVQCHTIAKQLFYRLKSIIHNNAVPARSLMSQRKKRRICLFDSIL